MTRARQPARRASDWGAWFPSGSRDAEVARLERELAESRAQEQRSRREAAEAKDRFDRLLESSRRFSHTMRDQRTQQRTSRKRLAAQHAVDSVLAEAEDLAGAVPDLLEALGGSLGWQKAVFWTADEKEGVLCCGGIWQKPDAGPAGFEAACRGTSFAGGEGLPGRAWKNNRVVWTKNLERDAAPRAEAGMAEGLRGALAFPISAGSRSFGVVELLDAGTPVPDKELHYTVGLVGTQIGRFAGRWETEEALEESRHLFRRIADTTPNILYLYDLTENRNVYVNRGVEKILGYSPEQVSAMGGDLIPHLLHPEDLPVAVEGVRAFDTLKDGEANELEYRMRHADGTYRYLRSHETVFSRTPEGRAWQILGVAQDITDRKEAEEALAEGEERLRLATEAGRVGVVEWDLTCDESRCSDVMAEIFGYPPGGYSPSYAGFLRRVHPEDRKRVRRTLDSSIAAGAPHELEFRIVRPDGEVRQVRSKGRVHQDKGGEPVRVVGITLDVTEQRRAEEERDQLRSLEVYARAETAERQRISRELHDRVAHSMGVAHQSLQLYEALAEKDPDRAQVRLQTANEMVKTALDQTRNLSMELRRSETEGGLIPALRDLLEITVPDDVSVELSASGEEALLTDQQRGQLYLVLREAVRNAVRHSGGSQISVGLNITREKAWGYVEDDGRGFGTNGDTNGKTNGNGGSRPGLGLQVIQERAALMGGRTQTYPSPEGGAGVEIRVPLDTGGG